MNEGSDLLQPRSWERLHEAVSNTVLLKDGEIWTGKVQ